MTHKEFTWWLKGYLLDKPNLSNGDTIKISEMLEKVVEGPRVTTFPTISDPNQIPRWTDPHITPGHPLNPTCNKQK